MAVTLEAEWNNKLRALDAAHEDYHCQPEADALLDAKKRQRVLALATDFPRLWRDSDTPARKRKARLLIEDVTLLKADDLVVHLRFRGGDTRSLRLARPKVERSSGRFDPSRCHRRWRGPGPPGRNAPVPDLRK